MAIAAQKAGSLSRTGNIYGRLSSPRCNIGGLLLAGLRHQPPAFASQRPCGPSAAVSSRPYGASQKFEELSLSLE